MVLSSQGEVRRESHSISDFEGLIEIVACSACILRDVQLIPREITATIFKELTDFTEL
jgi:hypothetical protein